MMITTIHSHPSAFPANSQEDCHQLFDWTNLHELSQDLRRRPRPLPGALKSSFFFLAALEEELEAEIHFGAFDEFAGGGPFDVAVEVTFVRSGGFLAAVVEVIDPAGERVGVARAETGMLEFAVDVAPKDREVRLSLVFMANPGLVREVPFAAPRHRLFGRKRFDTTGVRAIFDRRLARSSSPHQSRTHPS